MTSDPTGQIVGLSLYMPWGESRAGEAGTRLTDYGFNGQRSMEATIGLYYFNARWFDSSLGRWTQPDSIVPLASQGVQAWNRYEFVNSNSIKNTDSTGHQTDCKNDPYCVPPGKDINPRHNPGPETGDTGGQDSNNNGNKGRNGDKKKSEDNLITYFDVDLTPEDTQLLLDELNWWIEKGGSLQDLDTLINGLGFFAAGAAYLGYGVPEIGAAEAIVLWVGAKTSDNTVSDMEAFRYQLAMASMGGTKGVRLSMGANITSWNVSVNGAPAVSHNNYSVVTGLAGPVVNTLVNNHTIMNAFPAWILSWYAADYEPYYPK